MDAGCPNTEACPIEEDCPNVEVEAGCPNRDVEDCPNAESVEACAGAEDCPKAESVEACAGAEDWPKAESVEACPNAEGCPNVAPPNDDDDELALVAPAVLSGFELIANVLNAGAELLLENIPEVGAEVPPKDAFPNEEPKPNEDDAAAALKLNALDCGAGANC